MQPELQGYRIVRELGHGGMAVAYLAVQELFERLVALKVMTPSSTAGQDFAQRFIREARIIGHLSHPNIVPVYEVGERQGQYFFSMEFLPAGDLVSRIDDGLQIPEVIHIVSQIAKALDYAHTRGVIHRDVKPDNILFRSSGEAVLTDFGIARDIEDTGDLTVVETVVGSPRYMSPEQARGEKVDTRSDIFSLGVVLYEMLTGAVPFEGSSTAAIVLQQVEQSPLTSPPEATVLQPVLQKMTALEPDSRYNTALALLDDLDRISSTAGFSLTRGVRADAQDRIQEKPTVMMGADEIQQLRSRIQVNSRHGRSRSWSESYWFKPALIVLVLAVFSSLGVLYFLNSESRNTIDAAVISEDSQTPLAGVSAVPVIRQPVLSPGYYLFDPEGLARTPFEQTRPQAILNPTPDEVYLYSELAAGQASISLEEYARRYPRSIFTEILMVKAGDSEQLENVLYRAEAGEEAAQLILSELTDAGWGVPEDPAAALELARESARFDYTLGHYQVATILMQNNGDGEREAMLHLHQAADGGLFLAMNTLADIYTNRGGEAVQAKALALYRRSAELDDPEAMFKAGKILLEQGVGTGSRFEALSYLHKAADKGHVNAQLLLREATAADGNFTNPD